jgi:aminopeptidase
MVLVQQARRDLMHTYMQRSANGSLRWSIAMFPTNAYAQDAEMSLSDFEEFV